MTAPSVEPHVTAVLDALHAGLPANLPASLGVAPNVPVPYVVLFPDPGDVSQARLCGDRSQLWLRLAVMAIGAGPKQALWASDRVREVMLGSPPPVAGRVTHRMRQVGGDTLERDDDRQPPLYMQLTEYVLLSQPGAVS